MPHRYGRDCYGWLGSGRTVYCSGWCPGDPEHENSVEKLGAGAPAKVKRQLTEEEIRGIRESAANYVGDIETYLD